MEQSKFSYKLTFWFILIENGGKQKRKSTLRVKINQFCDGLCDTMRSSYVIDKMGGVKLPHPLLKSMGSVIWNNFLECRSKRPTLFARQNDFYALFASNKTKHILNKHFACSCSDTIYSKSIKKNKKNRF